ncbi:MAG: transposase [Candidatus Sumerlaeia bacterium]|nr:transposase [Candidatus Sumerlaeia bacterium]
MSQSLVQNYQHIIYSTKGREPFLTDPSVSAELHRYLGGVCIHHNSPSIIVGGHVDHVHIVCRLSKSLTIKTMVRELKVESSKWMKTRGSDYRRFRWQAGYGAFSISPSHVGALTKYVRNQEEHHRRESFQEEYLRLLHKYEVEYDERYLWD